MLLLVGLLTAGCSRSATSTTADLQPGRTWHLLEVRTAGTTLSPIPPTRASTILFHDGQLAGSDSVNTHHANYSETGDQLTLSNPDSTAVGIATETAEEGQVLLAMGKLFSSGPVTVNPTADRLEVTTGPYVLVFA